MTPLRVRLLSLAGAFSLGLVGVAVSTDTAMACSCVYAAEDPRNLERADVVFEGVIVDDSGAEQGSGTRRITLEVSRVFKGVASQYQLVLTSGSSASCGLQIKGPGSFLVFGTGPAKSRGTAKADLCGGTRAGSWPTHLGPGAARQQGDPWPSLGPAAPPVEGTSSVTTRWSTGRMALLAIAVTGGVAATVSAIWWAWRRRHPELNP